MSSCVFCEIIERKSPSRIVYEDDNVIAFEDVAPQAPVHTLVAPKKHIPTILHIREEDMNVIGHMITVSLKIARDKGIADKGFRLLTNCGAESGQSVYHLHFHVIGGRTMFWPPG